VCTNQYMQKISFRCVRKKHENMWKNSHSVYERTLYPRNMTFCLRIYVYMHLCMHISLYAYTCTHTYIYICPEPGYSWHIFPPFQWTHVSHSVPRSYGVATVRRIDKIVGLFCKRALQKRQYSAKETYDLIDPPDGNHPILATRG